MLLAVIPLDFSAIACEDIKQIDDKRRLQEESQIKQRRILEALHSGHQTIVPAQKSTGAPTELVLRVIFDERPYLLGAPIVVRCLLINETKEPVTVLYDYHGSAAKMVFRIRAPGGEEVEQFRDVISCYFSAPTVTIPSGQQFIHTICLSRDYSIMEPGEYEVTAEYKSDGKCRTFNTDKGTFDIKAVWGGVEATSGPVDSQGSHQRRRQGGTMPCGPMSSGI